MHGLKPDFLKWVANDLCKPITPLMNLVAKVDFSASWTIYIIRMIFTYGERHSPRKYRTIIIGKIFDKFCDFVLEKIIRRWVELKGVEVREQVSFKEGESTLDHTLIVLTFMNKKYLQVNVFILVLLISKKLLTQSYVSSLGNTSNN